MEFRSKLEDLMVAEELLFNATPGFGPYKRFLEDAIAHPAKMNTKLLSFLIENFTSPGETVLDPMCGSGSTGVVAALHGRNVVQVDIEEKFVKWAEEARAKVERQAVLSSKGKMQNICGDARKLSELLREVDIVLTSPPYAEVSHHSDDPKEIEHLRPGRTARVAGTAGNNENNIGQLSYVDAVVTSPPYSEAISKHAGGKCTLERVGVSTKTARSYDVIVTSPPYGEAQDGHGIAKEGYRGKKHSPTDLVGNRSYMPDKFESEQDRKSVV